MVDVLDGISALDFADELGRVFAAAFGAGYDEAEAERFATDQLPTHAARDDFKLVAAGSDEGIVGFAYGFTGRRGQWWSDRIAAAISPELASEWIGGHFEVVELAVHPAAQRNGLGTALMHALMHALMTGLPHRKALLTTYADDRPAPRLYRRLGWQVLVPDLGWGSALYGMDRGVLVGG